MWPVGCGFEAHENVGKTGCAKRHYKETLPSLRNKVHVRSRRAKAETIQKAALSEPVAQEVIVDELLQVTFLECLEEKKTEHGTR